MSHDLTKYAILKIACNTPKIFFAFIYLHLQFEAIRLVLENCSKNYSHQNCCDSCFNDKILFAGLFSFLDKSCGIVCTEKKLLLNFQLKIW